MPSPRSTIAVCGSARSTRDPLARALARRGARIVVAVDATARARPIDGALEIDALAGDLGSKEWMRQAWQAARRIDAVVVCAASPPRGDLARVGDVLKPTFFLAKHAVLRLRRRGGALLLVVPDGNASPAGRVADEALRAMLDGLARAAPAGVRVCALTASTRPARRRTVHAEPLARSVELLVEQGENGTWLGPFARATRG